jgi:hypothetical protein
VGSPVADLPTYLRDATPTTGEHLQVTILTGSIVRVWGVLEQVLQRHEHELSKADRSMRIVRVDMASSSTDKAPLVGVRYKDSLLPEVRLCMHEHMAHTSHAVGSCRECSARLRQLQGVHSASPVPGTLRTLQHRLTAQ